MLSRKVFKASALLAGTRMLARILDLISALVIARFLSPADFGLVTLATASLMILRAVTELPISETIVRKEELSAELLGTAFTLSALRGLAIATLMCAFAWPMAQIYDDHRLLALMPVLALSPLLGSLSSPAMVKFVRSVDFGPSATLQVSTKVVGFVASVLVAFLTGSYWSLVLALVLPPILACPISYWIAPHRPQITLREHRQILPFAGWVTLSRFLSTANGETDRFILGGLVSKESLGHFSMARSVATTTSWAVGMPITLAVFPGLATIRHDVPRLRSAYLRTQAAVVASIMPLGVILAFFAEPLVRLALGAQWLPAVPVIQVLGPMGAVATIAMPVYALTLAVGEPRKLALRDLSLFLLGIPAIAFSCWNFGLQGAVIARAILGLADILASMHIASNLIDISILRQLGNCWRSAIATVAMAGFCTFVPRLGSAHSLVIELLGLGTVVAGAMMTYVLVHMIAWALSGWPRGAEEFAVRYIRTGKTRLLD